MSRDTVDIRIARLRRTLKGVSDETAFTLIALEMTLAIEQAHQEARDLPTGSGTLRVIDLQEIINLYWAFDNELSHLPCDRKDLKGSALFYAALAAAGKVKNLLEHIEHLERTLSAMCHEEEGQIWAQGYDAGYAAACKKIEAIASAQE